MSQDQLAGQLHLTSRHVENYERGSDRIDASKLYALSRALHVPIAYFFDDYLVEQRGAKSLASYADSFVTDFLGTSEGIEIAKAFPRIGSAENRRRILELVQALADGELPRVPLPD